MLAAKMENFKSDRAIFAHTQLITMSSDFSANLMGRFNETVAETRGADPKHIDI